MTRTEIANIALHALGIGRIEDIADDDTAAEACRDLMSTAVSEVVNKVTVCQLLTRQALIPTGTPVDGWAASYAYPTAPPMLRPVRLASGADNYREGALLHTDDPAAVLVYVRKDFDPQDLPDHVADAIGLTLALRMASSQGKDERLAEVVPLQDKAIKRAQAIEGAYINPPTKPKLWGAPR